MTKRGLDLCLERSNPLFATVSDDGSPIRGSLVGNAKVSFGVAPNGVNVVGGILRRIVLDVKEFDDKRRPLDAVGVLFAGLHAAVLGEVDLVKARLAHVAHLGLSNVSGHSACLTLEKL